MLNEENKALVRRRRGGQRRLRRRFDQGAARPRRRAQAPGHVYRRHRRRLGPAPHGLRGGRQRHRRGAGRLREAGDGDAERRRLVHGHRRRARHSDRHPRGGRRLGGRGHHDPAARRRKIRPELLQGLRRPARRRRLGRQCAVDEARPAGLARRARARHRIRPWRRGRAADGRRAGADRRRQAEARHRGDLHAVARDLHHGRVRLRDDRAPAARTRLPEFRRPHRADRRAPCRSRSARSSTTKAGSRPSCAISTAPRRR